MPEGALQPKGNSNVRLAVVTIVAIHIVFFGSLLIVPGCSRDDNKNLTATNTTSTATGVGITSTESTAATNQYTMPPMNTDYYTSASNLPGATGTTAYADTRTSTNVDGFPGSTLPTDTGAIIPPIDTGSAVETAMQEYKIRPRDTLSKIAAMHRVSLSALVKANEGVDPSRLKIGQTIRIPSASTTARTGVTTGIGGGDSGVGATGTTGGGQQYVVKSGDTLTKIAREHRVSVKAIRQANALKTDRLLVNQKLKIPTSTAAATNATAPDTNPILQ